MLITHNKQTHGDMRDTDGDTNQQTSVDVISRDRNDLIGGFTPSAKYESVGMIIPN